jgi:hypothetical protein
MISTTTQSPVIRKLDSPTGKHFALAGAGNEIEQGSNRKLSKGVLISVKEGAHWLNISPSRIYRMDRCNGPFPIVKIGWRVFIELAGLVSFVAGSRGQLAPADAELPVLPDGDEAQNPAGTGDQNGSIVESSIPNAVTASDASRPLTEPMSPAQGFGSGQRDLFSGWVYCAKVF